MTHDAFYIHPDDSAGKGRILHEGLRLFAQNGLAGTSIRDIAKATGMSNPALYKHFKTKHEVALVLFERLYREHLRRLALNVSRHSGFPAKLRAFVDSYLEAYAEHPHGAIFTADNFITLWPDMPPNMKRRTVITVLRELLELGRSDGGVRADDDIDLQMALIIGTLGQVTRQMYFRTLSGPAMKHADGLERLLKAGLS